ncbi:MAG: tRNA pseudouridine(38-40) synthase TruA [Humidesulfovibrio sp.]
MDARAGLCYVPPMARIKLILAYDGTDFAGWQLQARDRTVQGEVEAAIARIVGTRLPVQGAGRTDSGVHALGQCAHFDAPEQFAHIPWRVALNCLMRPDVRVVQAEVAPPRFHAQYDAVSKIYAYTLWTDRSHVNPLRRRFVWDVPPLDLAAMDEAAREFLGTHDFASFRNAGTPLGPRGTVRTVQALWREPGPGAAETVWRIRGDGFLKQMVRNIVGCLVAVGKGKVAPADVRSILERRDRNHSLPTAPPWGLCMERVFYPEPELGDDAARGRDTAHDEHQVADSGGRDPDGPERGPAD